MSSDLILLIRLQSLVSLRYVTTMLSFRAPKFQRSVSGLSFLLNRTDSPALLLRPHFPWDSTRMAAWMTRTVNAQAPSRGIKQNNVVFWRPLAEQSGLASGKKYIRRPAQLTWSRVGGDASLSYVPEPPSRRPPSFLSVPLTA